jgi:hypothetical protein
MVFWARDPSRRRAGAEDGRQGRGRQGASILLSSMKSIIANIAIMRCEDIASIAIYHVVIFASMA